MEKIYEMANRHKQELIETYIKPNLPYSWNEGDRELVLYDNVLNDPMFKINEIVSNSGKYEVKFTDLTEWATPDFGLERDLINFEYEQLETIAEFFNSLA